MAVAIKGIPNYCTYLRWFGMWCGNSLLSSLPLVINLSNPWECWRRFRYNNRTIEFLAKKLTILWARGHEEREPSWWCALCRKTVPLSHRNVYFEKVINRVFLCEWQNVAPDDGEWETVVSLGPESHSQGECLFRIIIFTVLTSRRRGYYY